MTSGSIAWCLVVAGCAPPTSDLKALFQLSESMGRLQVIANFADGNSAFDGDERVSVAFRGRTARLADSYGSYVGGIDLDAPLEADEIVKIFVDRDGELGTTSMFALPPPWVIAPVPLFVSRSADLVIRWAPVTDDEMSWSGDFIGFDACLPGGAMIPPGAPSLTIPATMPGIGIGDPGTCTATITLQRYRKRPADPAFRDSLMVFTQEQVIQFASTP